MRQRMQVFIVRVDIVRPVCNSIAGEEHSFPFRACVGVGVAFMLVGVMVAKYAGEIEYKAVSVVGDAMGYSLRVSDSYRLSTQ